MVDSDETTLTGGTFDATYTLDSTYATPVTFRVIPDTGVNSPLSVASTIKSDIKTVQPGSNYAYIFWKDNGAIRAQYMDTSAASSISIAASLIVSDASWSSFSFTLRCQSLNCS